MNTKKQKQITVVVKEVGKAPEVKTIENELKPFQSIVQGLIELLPLTACDMNALTGETKEQAKGILIICNEEGLIYNMKLNFYTSSFNAIVGPALFVSDDGEEFGSLSEEQQQFVIKWLKYRSYHYTENPN